MSKSPTRGAKSPRKLPVPAGKKRASSRSQSPAKARGAGTRSKSEEPQDAVELGMLTTPISTVYYFSLSLTEFLLWLAHMVVKDKRFQFVGVPVLALIWQANCIYRLICTRPPLIAMSLLPVQYFGNTRFFVLKHCGGLCWAFCHRLASVLVCTAESCSFSHT